MDKKSIIGLVLIGFLLIGYMYLTKPSQEQIARTERRKDSLAMAIKHDSIEKELAQQRYLIYQDSVNRANIASGNIDTILNQEAIDSLNQVKLLAQYGAFHSAVKGDEEFFFIENDKMIITLTNKGGKIYSVELKDYKTYHQEPLILFENDKNSTFGLELIADNRTISTNDMFFEPSKIKDVLKADDKDVNFSMRLIASENKYIEYLYTVHPDSYMIDFDINFVGFENELEYNQYITLRWNSSIPALERGRDWESNNTTVYLSMSDEDIESLSETKEEDNFTSRAGVKWVAYKQQFFTSALIAKNKLENPNIKSIKFTNPDNKFLKRFESSFSLNMDEDSKTKSSYNFYFGPNSYYTLKEYDLKLEKVVPLGWGIFGWVNKLLVIPIFHWLGSFITSYGLIIFLLTLIIKLILFPLTYKSYLSTAKMRVLKPQIDEISEKFPKGKEMEKQQATMALYKKAGVSPLGGCIPMLIQFPILIAMFRFFPASIELRQQSFLWANDLSTYDSIIEWTGNIPIISSIYGNHVSLFTLLMAVSIIFSTKINSATQPSNASMPGMKMMMYMMPVMMLFWFNNYSSGLSYYYLLANIITIVQTIIIQKFIVDEKKILAQLEMNKKKPKTKSKWQQRLEEAAKRKQQGK